jgi:ABC-type Fe3+ transport system permease subunit
LWLLLALFVIYPLLMMLSAAFLEEGRPTLALLFHILGKPSTRAAFLNSLLLGALVGLVGTVLGFLFAFTVVRGHLRPRWVRLIDAATLLPLISPPFTTSISFIFSFGPRGLITYDLLGLKGVNVYGLTSTLAAEALTYFPIAYLTLRPVLSGISGNLEEMAFGLGSRRLHMFRTVTLRLAVPGLANAFLLLFAASLADFATPLILAGNVFPVLPTEAYLQITGLFDLKGCDPVCALARTSRDRLPPATQLGRARPLRDRDRQAGPAVLDSECHAGGTGDASHRLCRHRSVHPLSLWAARVCVPGGRLRRRPHVDATALSGDLQRRPQGHH